MTRKEFEDLTQGLITAEDYDLVHNLYMAAGDMGKDEFCMEMRVMCAHGAANDHIELPKCLKEVGRRVGEMNAGFMNMKKIVTKEIEELVECLIGKSRAYEDGDFRRMAVRLAGEREVVLQTIKMGLPLWEEDKEFIKTNLQ